MATSIGDKVSIIGCGRLGLCTALILEKSGYTVVGVDVFPSYVDQLNQKKITSLEPHVTEYLAASKNFRATTSIDEAINHSDLILILVDTPTGVAEKSYNHSNLSRVLSQINDRKVKNKHVVICCTVLPGYIATVGRFLLRECENTSLSYNPEFIAQGSIIDNFLAPDMVLIGQGTETAGDILEGVYHRIVQNKPIICRMSPESAEITKLSINCFITMKISYCNMIGDIADKSIGADKYDVLRAVGADSRIGTKCLRPGYGFGGPCFPRDNRALAWYAQSVGVQPMLSHATDNYNKFHANLMVEALLAENKEVYEFEDVTYKENCAVPIIEESQKLIVARLLTQKGKKVLIRDRAIVIQEVQREYGNVFQYDIKP
eukprot:TRINITY_DN4643_c0_g1_i1.p1 TRINITY_DN4643_c0_g1~~TRINITY_DN4643_c0_g1_i1.p1  ORF type:complete len:375 (+),score=115.07 TRINITY_DN4643_c0_g1_i1:119-1243(+)